MFANILKADSLLFLILGILACYRLAQLIVYDDAPFGLMDRFRSYLGRQAGINGKYGVWWSLAELINCPYCVGLWLSLLIVIGFRPDYFLLYWLAIAGGQAWLNNHDTTE